MTLILSGTDGLSDIDGSAATPAIRGTDANTGIFFPAADTIAFSEGGVESMRIDSSGNVGIGTSSPGTRVHASIASATAYTTSSRANVLTVQNTTAGGYAGIEFLSEPSSGNAGIAGINSFAPATGDSVLTFSTRSSSTLAERARIDSSGNVGIGTSSPAVKLHIETSSGSAAFFVNSPSATDVGSYISLRKAGSAKFLLGVESTLGGTSDNGALYVYGANALTMHTNGSERARITSSGDLLVGKTNASEANVGTAFGVGGDSYFTRSGSTNSNSTLHVYSTGAGAFRFYVGMGGTVYATSTTITAISDQRLKENIQDIDAGLAQVLALKPRKFDWKEGKGKNKKGDRGWIAQEFEQVFPDMIDEWRDPAPEGEEPYKAVNADLIPVLVKAIQELKAINDAQAQTIQSLTARIEALEGK